MPTEVPRLFVIRLFPADEKIGPALTIWGHSWDDRAIVSWRLPGTAERQLATFSSAEAAEATIDRAYPRLTARLAWCPPDSA